MNRILSVKAEDVGVVVEPELADLTALTKRLSMLILPTAEANTRVWTASDMQEPGPPEEARFLWAFFRWSGMCGNKKMEESEDPVGIF